jgi:hypothetical protein
MILGRFKKVFILAAAMMLLATPLQSNAGVVPLGNSGWEAIWDAGLDPFVDIVVDGETSNAVFIQKFAQFLQPPGPGGIFAGLNIQFRQTRPGAVPFIVINDEVVTNSTGAAWFDFHFELIDGGDVTFDPARTAASGGPAPIGFSISPFTIASYGSGNTTLDMAGGVVPNGGVWFPGNGPSDGQLWINAAPTTAGPFRVFTLKERPSIPEPASLSVLALGGLALIRRRK